MIEIEQLKQKIKTTLVGGFHLDMHRLLHFIKTRKFKFNKSVRRFYFQDLLKPIFEQDRIDLLQSIYQHQVEMNDRQIQLYFKLFSLSQLSDSQLLIEVDHQVLTKRLSREQVTETTLLLLIHHELISKNEEFLIFVDELLDKPARESTSIDWFLNAIDPFFVESPGEVDGLIPNQWRTALYCASSLDDLYAIGQRFGLSLPKTVNKPILHQRILNHIQKQGIQLNPKRKQHIDKASISGLIAIGEELNLPYEKGLFPTELIELILFNVKSKVKYEPPTNMVVYTDIQLSVFNQCFNHLLGVETGHYTETNLKEKNLAEFLYLHMLQDTQTLLIDYKRKFDEINQHIQDVKQHEVKSNKSTNLQGKKGKSKETNGTEKDQIQSSQKQKLSSEELLVTLHQRLDGIQSTINDHPTRQEISQLIPHQVIEKTTQQLQLQDENFAKFEQQLLIIRDNFKDHLLDSRAHSRKSFFPLFLVFSNLLLVALVLFFTLSQTDTSYLYLNSPRVLLVNEVESTTFQLVPKGSPVRNGQVDEYTFEFKPAYQTNATIEISIIEESKMIGDLNNPFNHLLILQLYILNVPQHDQPIETLEVDLIQTERMNVYSHQVYVRLFIVPPDDPNEYEDAYEHLAGKQLSFSMLFEVLDETR